MKNRKMALLLAVVLTITNLTSLPVSVDAADFFSEDISVEEEATEQENNLLTDEADVDNENNIEFSDSEVSSDESVNDISAPEINETSADLSSENNSVVEFSSEISDQSDLTEITSIEICNLYRDKLIANLDTCSSIFDSMSRLKITYSDNTSSEIYLGRDFIDLNNEGLLDHYGHLIHIIWKKNNEEIKIGWEETLDQGNYTLQFSYNEISSEKKEINVVSIENSEQYQGDLNLGINQIKYSDLYSFYRFIPIVEDDYEFKDENNETIRNLELYLLKEDGSYSKLDLNEATTIHLEKQTYYVRISGQQTIHLQKHSTVNNIAVDIQNFKNTFKEGTPCYASGITLKISLTDFDSDIVTFGTEKFLEDKERNIYSYTFQKQSASETEIFYPGDMLTDGRYKLLLYSNGILISSNSIYVDVYPNLPQLNTGSNYIHYDQDYRKDYLFIPSETGKYKFSPVDTMSVYQKIDDQWITVTGNSYYLIDDNFIDVREYIYALEANTAYKITISNPLKGKAPANEPADHVMAHTSWDMDLSLCSSDDAYPEYPKLYTGENEIRNGQKYLFIPSKTGSYTISPVRNLQFFKLEGDDWVAQNIKNSYSIENDSSIVTASTYCCELEANCVYAFQTDTICKKVLNNAGSAYEPKYVTNWAVTLEKSPEITAFNLWENSILLYDGININTELWANKQIPFKGLQIEYDTGEQPQVVFPEFPHYASSIVNDKYGNAISVKITGSKTNQLDGICPDYNLPAGSYTLTFEYGTIKKSIPLEVRKVVYDELDKIELDKKMNVGLGCRVADRIVRQTWYAFESDETTSYVFKMGSGIDFDIRFMNENGTTGLYATWPEGYGHHIPQGKFLISFYITNGEDRENGTMTVYKDNGVSPEPDPEEPTVPSDDSKDCTWIETKRVPATCWSDGWLYETCIVHGNSRVTRISEKGHQMNYGYTAKSATCTSDGEYIKQCIICGYQEKEILPATQHNNGLLTLNEVPATCEQDGYIIKDCMECHDIIHEILPATGHKWEETVTIPAEENKSGERYHICSICNKREVLEILPATAVEEKVNSVNSKLESLASDTDQDTLSEITQEIVSLENTELIKKNDIMETISRIEQLTVDTNKNVGETILDSSADVPEIKNVKGAALTAAIAVQDTDVSEEKVLATKLSVTNVSSEKYQSESDTLAMSIKMSIVDTVNDTLIDGKEDIQPESPVQLTLSVPEDYQNRKLTLIHVKEDSTRESIDYEFNSDKTEITFKITSLSDYLIKAGSCLDNHILDDNTWQITKQATCNQIGKRTNVCNVCNETITEDIMPQSHIFSQSTGEVKSATCTTEGYEMYECENCHITRKTILPATGHQWKLDQQNSVAATCLSAGKEHYICENPSCSETYDKEIDILSHDWNKSKITPSTCSTTGRENWICKNCNAQQTNVAIPVDPDAHNFTWIKDSISTCKTAGSKHEECIYCHIIRNTVSIPATGNHQVGSWKVIKRASVSAEGIKERECTICGATTDRETIDKLSPTVSFNVSLNKTLPLKVKQSFKIVANNLANGDKIVSWNTNKRNILSVSSNGKITGKKAGTVIVTVKLKSGLKKNIKVKVQNKAVSTSSIQIVDVKTNKKVSRTVALKNKGKLYLKTTVTPVTSKQKITYSSSDKKTATVNSKGVITARKKGSTIISVKSGKKTVRFKIIVK